MLLGIVYNIIRSIKFGNYLLLNLFFIKNKHKRQKIEFRIRVHQNTYSNFVIMKCVFQTSPTKYIRHRRSAVANIDIGELIDRGR